MNASPQRFLPLLLPLFVGSGCAALIYEIVWFQLLQLVIGSSAVSLAVLLGTFMGGMCLGSLGLARVVRHDPHPLRLYALLEAGIALCAVLLLLTAPLLAESYSSLVGHGLPGILLRASVGVIALLPPTILMGSTLPAVARWVESSPRGIAWLGYFYGGNTAGAVLGCLAAGFYLLRVHDLPTATGCAVAINLVVAALAIAIAAVTPHAKSAPRSVTSPTRNLSTEGAASVSTGDDEETNCTLANLAVDPTGAAAEHPDSATAGSVSLTPTEPAERRALVTIALSGLCALAAEVVWTRQLSLLLGATVYTFSIILAVFLTGLGIGSTAGAALARRHAAPLRALALCQILQVAAIAWAAHAIAQLLPYWSVGATVKGLSAKFGVDLVRCASAILPSAVLWGASFPLALASVAPTGRDAPRRVGRVYAANTFGAILGAVAASLVLIPQLGTRVTQTLLILIAALAALLAAPPQTSRGWRWLVFPATAIIAIAWSLPQIPWQLVAYGRQIATTDYGARPLFFGEGMNSSVAVSETPGGARFFHVSGKTEASSLAKDMRLQRMLGHIPALLHRAPKSVLIVGCGAGVTSGSFVLYPSVERIVICDIEPLIPRVVARHFGAENHDVLRDPRVEVVYDDARHYIATTRERFDIITSDPIHPWVKGSAVLYSQEYFELCRRRLNPGGLVTQWVPLYEADRAVVQSEIATFFSVFPEGTIWANDDDGYGYDTVMLGQAEPLTIDIDHLQQRLDRDDHTRVRAALQTLGLGTAVDLLSTYAGRHADLRTWLSAAEINRDRNLRLQYLAGLQLDSNNGTDAYYEILGQRDFPLDLFRGSPVRVLQLRQALAQPPTRP